MFVHELSVKDYPDATIRLTAPKMDYAPLSLKWVSDLEVGQYMGADFTNVSLKTEQDRIEDQLNNPDLVSWMIEYNGQIIGNVEINDIKNTSEAEHRKAGRFSTLIGEKEYWGRRISPAVKTAVLDWAFSEGGFELMVARALEQNERSWRSLEHMNFQFRGFQGEMVHNVPSRWKVYTLDKDQWGKLRKG